MIQKAFKIACLKYRPSLVPFKGQNLDRTELILKKQELLKDVHHHSDNAEDFNALQKQANALKDLIATST